jgi:hypothetical protein
MALDDLVTVDQARVFIEPQGDRDALLGTLITRASRLARSYTSRRFTSPPFVGERRFYLLQSRYVHTDDPVSAIAYVRGEAPFGATVEGEPVSGQSGVYDLSYREPSPEDPEQQLHPVVVLEAPYGGPVVVSASFGWSAIPEDVQQAVLLTVGIWFERDIANTSTTFSLDERRTQRPEALPAQARDMLAHYQFAGAGIG